MKSIFPDIDKTRLDSFYIRIGQNVKRIRKEKGLTQLELAILIGQRSTSFYSNCENYKNKEHFNLEHLFFISDTLKVDIIEFFK
ncbi:MAG: XRE family transcriptional regulator [Erysipelotrichia bacterium]|nr:XRE family transcriptional regulator [Erysipelotrichia bacterium]